MAKFPILYTAAMKILAIPAMQVIVKRAFSTLNFILSDSRANLKTETLNDILIIRYNENYINKD
jgi:hypothetical protein